MGIVVTMVIGVVGAPVGAFVAELLEGLGRFFELPTWIIAGAYGVIGGCACPWGRGSQTATHATFRLGGGR
jgi:uncharacterized membrane protein YeaQ/YmgE (transglycosylase-associated protein family)